jgi:hypothetical protein
MIRTHDLEQSRARQLEQLKAAREASPDSMSGSAASVLRDSMREPVNQLPTGQNELAFVKRLSWE